MTPFASKKHILLIWKPIWLIFVALNALNVEYKIILRFKDNRAMTKDLELQIANWFHYLKPSCD
jgi:hypothetical protein